MNSPRPRWGPLRSLLILAPVLVGAPWWSLRLHLGAFHLEIGLVQHLFLVYSIA